MNVRVSPARIVVAALLIVGLGTTGDFARASSISSSDAAAIGTSAATAATEFRIEPAGNELSLTGLSDSQTALELVADAGLNPVQPPLSLVLGATTEPAATAKKTPAAPTFLTAAALPLNLSDVPEPTTFGLFLLGLAGLFVARRIARKA